MSIKGKRWKYPVIDPVLQSRLVKHLNLSPIMAQILINRGISDEKEVSYFLEGGLELLSDPFLMPGMDKAVERISLALKRKEKILVYGDYDADGITSTALLLEYLRLLKADAGYYLPDRQEEGYGLHKAALKKVCREGYSLVITVDCGISAVEEVEFALERGLDVVVTDHHQIPAKIPRARAIVNPRLSSHGEDLAGVGVVFKLVQALDMHLGSGIDCVRFLDLVALGSIADLVPLRGENRILVKKGLEVLSSKKREGLKALMEVSGIEERDISTYDVGFVLAPRLNAAGRLSHARPAVELLITSSSQYARELACALHRKNEARQLVEAQITKEVFKYVETEVDLESTWGLVLDSPLWHPGVIGVVAARVAERFYRPTFLIAVQGEKGKGSGRSVSGFDLFKELSQCSDLLSAYGGHSQAAGLTINASLIEEFRERFNKIAGRAFNWKTPEPELNLEGEVFLTGIDSKLIRELKKLEPHGPGNPRPLVAFKGASVVSCRKVGKDGGHIKLKVKGEELEFEAIGFNLAEAVQEITAAGSRIDIAFQIELNKWKEREHIQFKIEDIRPGCRSVDIKTVPLLGKKNHNYLLLGSCFIDNFTGEGSTELEKNESSPVIVVDNRNCPEKMEYVLDLIKKGESLVIYVNSPLLAVKLSHMLRTLVGNTVFFYHEDLSKEKKALVKALYKEGALNHIVATKFICPKRCCDHLIFWDLPQSPLVFKKMLQISRETCPGKVHLLFRTKRRENLGSHLNRLFPERENLGKLYFLLNKRAGAGGRVTVGEEEMIYLYRKAGLSLEAPALEILEELKLFRFEKKEDKYSMYFFPSKTKKNLNDSPLFQKTQRAKDNFLKYYNFLIDGKEEEIKQYIINSLRR